MSNWMAHIARMAPRIGWRRDRRGTVAVTFALAIVPLTFAIGAAVDYSGATALKAHLQRATDGTGLQLCQLQNAQNSEKMSAIAATMMTSYMGTASFNIDAVAITPSPHSIQLSTSAQYQTQIVRAFGVNQIPVAANVKCFNDPETFEIALVLDNTGSMSNSNNGQSKMDALKAAATSFVNYVYSSANMASGTRISLVPFAAAVAVDPNANRYASWIDQNGQASFHWSFLQGGAATVAPYTGYVHSRLDVFSYFQSYNANWGWAGCFESQPYPLNTQDGGPVSSNPDSYYVPMFAPDESGPGGSYSHQDGNGNTIYTENSYIDDTNGYCQPTTDEPTLTGQACKYIQLTDVQTTNGFLSTGPNFSCTTRPLTRLTNNQSLLASEISQMSPNGNTDIHEGVQWGWRTLSPNSVFADGVSYTQPLNNKILILMTDGTNTWYPNPGNPTLKSFYSAYGFLSNSDGSGPNARLPPGNANPQSSNDTRAALDALTLQSCQNARSAGIVIYTIGFSVPNDPIDQAGISLLQQCAGDTSRAYVASDSTTLQTVFQRIAQNIGTLKLIR